MTPFQIIVAIDKNNGIGAKGQLPWHIPEDLKYFKKITTQCQSEDLENVVIMGRKTWESIPEKFKPLPDRLNVVLSTNKDYKVPEGVILATGFDEAFALLEGPDIISRWEQVFVIGGAGIFRTALELGACQGLFVTFIDESFECDTFFPDFQKNFKLAHSSEIIESKGIKVKFTQFVRKE